MLLWKWNNIKSIFLRLWHLQIIFTIKIIPVQIIFILILLWFSRLKTHTFFNNFLNFCTVLYENLNVLLLCVAIKKVCLNRVCTKVPSSTQGLVYVNLQIVEDTYSTAATSDHVASLRASVVCSLFSTNLLMLLNPTSYYVRSGDIESYRFYF